ncbi:hypothetical protein V8E36_006440, partial [Tilletia maclaganii]
DYCDILLTHNSIAARKDHNSGRNHLANVRNHYQHTFNETPALTQSIHESVLKHYADEGLPPPQLPQTMGRGGGAPSMFFGSGPLSG